MIDYRKRCVIDGHIVGVISYDVIRYGATARETNDEFNDQWRDHAPRDYHDLSAGGRRPGRAIEVEYARNRHFFNQRIA